METLESLFLLEPAKINGKHGKAGEDSFDAILERLIPGDHARWFEDLAHESIHKLLGCICGQLIRSAIFDIRAYKECDVGGAADLFGNVQKDPHALRRLYSALGWVFNLYPTIVSFEQACALAVFRNDDQEKDLPQSGGLSAASFRTCIARALAPEIACLYREIVARDSGLSERAVHQLEDYIDPSRLKSSLH